MAADHTMATVLFISVFVFLFFKFCLGVPPLGPAGAEQAAVVEGGVSNLAAADLSGPPPPPLPLPMVRKCPVGTVYSVAVGACKDLVRSTKE